MNLDGSLALVDRLYAAALGECDWHQLLRALLRETGGDGATFEVIDLASGRHLEFVSENLDPAGAEPYRQHFASLSPRIAYVRAHDDPIATDDLFISEGEMDRSEFYQDFLAPQGLRYFVSLQVRLDDPSVLGAVSLQTRPGTQGRLDGHRSDLALLEAHLRRALRLYWNRSRNQLDAGRLDLALARLGLTAAERRLARGLACGESVAAYARRTGRSPNTIYTHYARLKQKLDSHRQSDLIERLHQL